jgi:flavin reductase (DIM6/NTAB) family NADH-FMN oxidoreductase RutF
MRWSKNPCLNQLGWRNRGGKMSNSPISITEISLKSFSIWQDQWFLLTCGEFTSRQFNSMTISWGSIGVMWNKPFIQVVVRPSRYTFEFMQKYLHFTVCAFPEPYRGALELLGSESGRDGNKIAKAKVTPCNGLVVNAPVFMEANLIFECRKIYADAFHPQHFVDPAIENSYNGSNYHMIYYGEILAITGDRTLYT